MPKIYDRGGQNSPFVGEGIVKSLDKLQRYGWYKEDLIEHIRRKIENVKTNIPENT